MKRLNGTLAMALAAAAILAAAPAPSRAETQSALDATIADVAKTWPDVPHMSQDEAVKAVSDGRAVLFDARSPEEFAVSHIEGAVPVDPAIRPDDFIAKYGADLKGTTAVFYCAVGVRSSKLAQRVGPGLKEAGAAGMASLKGGIFGWANAARPLVDARGPTDKVRGYDSSWSKMVDKPSR